MLWFDNSGLPEEISKKVNHLFYSSFSKTNNISIADVILTGIEPLTIHPWYMASYVVCPCTNANHVLNLSGHTHTLFLGYADTQSMSDIVSTAEHTVWLILGLLKRYNRWEEPGHTLKNKKVGIIGYGRIGKQVHKILQAFGCDVGWVDVDFGTFTLPEILPWADIITIHASTHPGMRPILNGKEFELIKDGACLINTSRGEAINEETLLKHIERLGGVALDVTTCLPDSDNYRALAANEHCVLTAHTGGYTIEDLTKTSEMMFEILKGRHNELKNE